jgi:AraC-like DNA-binding protein
MTIAFHKPSPPLDLFVECFWYVDLRVPYRRERILPMGTVELIFNFSDPFKLGDDDNSLHRGLSGLCTDSWLVGLQTGYLINEPLGVTCLIGVRFKPGGAYPFFQLPASELHNQVVPLDILWRSFAAEVRERLYAERTVTARFMLLEKLLLNRLHDLPHGFEVVCFAVDEIARRYGTIAILALSEQLGMSQKHLISQFKRIVGVSPKSLARIYRFQRVLNAVNPTCPVDWTAIAHDALYYDQSHFNRDFESFTGLTPSSYLHLRQEVFGHTLTQGESVHFVPVG